MLLLAAAAHADPGASAAPPPPREEVLALALHAYACARAEGALARPALGVIDYSLPSTEPRLWLIDPHDGSVLRRELVAHGRGSGGLHATRFSNAAGSHRSSLGLFVTGEPYEGRHGPSLRLHGLEPGVNDAAYERAIVFHAAWYATPDHAARHGRLGRSHGCPAVAPDVAPEVLEALEGGAALFVYGDDPDWLARWRTRDCHLATAAARGAVEESAARGLVLQHARRPPFRAPLGLLPRSARDLRSRLAQAPLGSLSSSASSLASSP